MKEINPKQKLLIYLNEKYKGDFNKIQKALLINEKIDEEEWEKINLRIQENNFQISTIFEENYPEIFKFCSHPPYVIYYYGDLKYLNDKNNQLIMGTNIEDSNIKNIQFEEEYGNILNQEEKELYESLKNKKIIEFIDYGIVNVREKENVLSIATTIKTNEPQYNKVHLRHRELKTEIINKVVLLDFSEKKSNLIEYLKYLENNYYKTKMKLNIDFYINNNEKDKVEKIFQSINWDNFGQINKNYF